MGQMATGPALPPARLAVRWLLFVP